MAVEGGLYGGYTWDRRNGRESDSEDAGGSHSEFPQCRKIGPLVIAHGFSHTRRATLLLSTHLVIVNNAPEAAVVGVGRHALEDNLGGAVEHRAVGDIRVAGDPAAIGGAEEDVVFL